MSSHLPRLPACQLCAQKKTKCDNSRPKCSCCARSGIECVIVNPADNARLSRELIDELEKREKLLASKIRALKADSNVTCNVLESFSPDGSQTVKSVNASSPAARGGAGLGFVARLFDNADWRKSHASLLRTLSNAPDATAEVLIAPCSLPSGSEAQLLFEKYLSWSHIQSPFLLRREVWELHRRLFVNAARPEDAAHHDLFRAFLICAIGSILPYRNGLHRQHPEGYYHSALQYFGPQCLTRGLDSAQDLLLVCRFGIYYYIGTSIWDVIRLCGRLCIELGLHLKTDDEVDLLQAQRKRRVFWQFYMIDRYSSTTLDRPFLIDDRDIEIGFPVDADDEELERASSSIRTLDAFCSTRDPGSRSETTIVFVSFRLRQISSRIHTEFSRLKQEQRESSPTHLLVGHVHVVLVRLLQELELWRRNAPMIADPSCLYEMQEWYDLLHARERLYLVRRAIDLAPRMDGTPSRNILSILLKTALETIEQYYSLYKLRGLMTHTRSYFHMLFTAGLSVMYCISVSQNLTPTDLQASSESLLHCQETLVNMSGHLSDARAYVAVFEALHHDISRKLRPHPESAQAESMARELHMDEASLASLPDMYRGTFLQATADRRQQTMNLENNPGLSSESFHFDETLIPSSHHDDANGRYTMGAQLGDSGTNEYSPGGNGDLINWGFLTHDSLWNMESALGQFAYGDPITSGFWDGFGF
ncbi:fungal-specific transcription factor domain-containing protein [Dactylonectria estremocensis]|uniref:Fungal-specific transcription factor domain-containing protein n=1 Tax=Dactylonectria estremocensis TaxID=1079267 RepID=A0A9P9FHL3_9HYPO|nr:fungal-specific transcription factor domain-containing protein [Dactylonectria estremocensis]